MLLGLDLGPAALGAVRYRSPVIVGMGRERWRCAISRQRRMFQRRTFKRNAIVVS